jgi:hypothetical protein
MTFRVVRMRRVHRAALKHGIHLLDIEHAMKHPMRVIPREDGARLYLGPARNADLLEVLTVIRPDESELAIHAMKIRPKYASLLPRE